MKEITVYIVRDEISNRGNRVFKRHSPARTYAKLLVQDYKESMMKANLPTSTRSEMIKEGDIKEPAIDCFTWWGRKAEVEIATMVN